MLTPAPTIRDRWRHWILDGRKAKPSWSGEGGYVNRKTDLGGPTNHGITWRTLADAEAAGLVPRGTTVAGLTRELALAIYEAWYWTPIHGNDLPGAIALAVFDGAVNSGVHTSATWLQRALRGAVDVDGVIGFRTVAAAQAAPQVELLERIRAEREDFLTDLMRRKPDQVANQAGWWARLDALEAECRDVIAGGERA